MRLLPSLTLLLALPMAACSQIRLSDPNVENLHLAFKRAICLNTVAIAGKSTDDEYTRRQIKRQNARVMACPEEWRRMPEP